MPAAVVSQGTHSPKRADGLPLSTLRGTPANLACASLRCKNSLRLEKCLQSKCAVLATDTRLLKATERCSRLVRERVDEDSTGFDPRRDLPRTLRIRRKHVRLQAVVGVVSDGDRIFSIAVRDDRQHRAEDFFAGNRHVVRDV